MSRVSGCVALKQGNALAASRTPSTVGKHTDLIGREHVKGTL